MILWSVNNCALSYESMLTSKWNEQIRFYLPTEISGYKVNEQEIWYKSLQIYYLNDVKGSFRLWKAVFNCKIDIINESNTKIVDCRTTVSWHYKSFIPGLSAEQMKSERIVWNLHKYKLVLYLIVSSVL